MCERSYDPSLTYFTGKAQAVSYLLYSDTSLIRSSVEILLLSCLKSGEKRDSRSSAPWLSLNTDLEPFERVWNVHYNFNFKAFGQMSYRPLGTDLMDQANGMRYFPSLLQNCLLSFNNFWTVCSREKRGGQTEGYVSKTPQLIFLNRVALNRCWPSQRNGQIRGCLILAAGWTSGDPLSYLNKDHMERCHRGRQETRWKGSWKNMVSKRADSVGFKWWR